MQRNKVPPELRAVVAKVCESGEKQFVVTYPQTHELQGGNVTFSMKDWNGTDTPRHGQVVILSKLHMFAKGWRALSACPAEEVTS